MFSPSRGNDNATLGEDSCDQLRTAVRKTLIGLGRKRIHEFRIENMETPSLDHQCQSESQ